MFCAVAFVLALSKASSKAGSRQFLSSPGAHLSEEKRKKMYKKYLVEEAKLEALINSSSPKTTDCLNGGQLAGLPRIKFKEDLDRSRPNYLLNCLTHIESCRNCRKRYKSIIEQIKTCQKLWLDAHFDGTENSMKYNPYSGLYLFD